MSNTAPSRAVFPLSRWCPPQKTSQPHPPIYCVLDRPVFESNQIVLHPELTLWWSFLFGDGAHHKKPHSPTHPCVSDGNPILQQPPDSVYISKLYAVPWYSTENTWHLSLNDCQIGCAMENFFLSLKIKLYLSWGLSCCKVEHPSETHLKLRKSCLSITYFSVALSFWNFAQSMAVSLPCSVQNFTMIWLLKCMLWCNKISKDLS